MAKHAPKKFPVNTSLFFDLRAITSINAKLSADIIAKRFPTNCPVVRSVPTITVMPIIAQTIASHVFFVGISPIMTQESTAANTGAIDNMNKAEATDVFKSANI